MLSDEERKAIEYLKRHILPCYGRKGTIEFMLNDIVLNLIEKQSKEIEELKNEVMEKELIIDGMKEDRRIAVEEIQEQYYVSKDEIKAKIEDILNSENSEAIEKLIEWHSLLEKEYKNEV